MASESSGPLSESSSSDLKPFLQILNKKNEKQETSIFLLDGGTGEELFARGLPDDRTTWSAKAVAEPQYHELLMEVHRAFLNAGARAVTVNSYGITQHVGFSEEQVREYCTVAAQLARRVVEEQKQENSKNRLFVLGSLGPLAESYRPDLVLEESVGVERYMQMMESIDPYVDVFLAETMSSVEESLQAVLALSRRQQQDPSANSATKAMMISYTLDSQGNIRSGEKANLAVQRILQYTSEHKVQCLAILFNCAEPEAISTALECIHKDKETTAMLSDRSVLLGAYANRLTPVAPDWTFAESTEAQPMRSDLDPERYYNEFVRHWVKDLNVKLVGGCCGITPQHIQFLHDKFS